MRDAHLAQRLGHGVHRLLHLVAADGADAADAEGLHLGGQLFIALRDREGLVQCSFNPDWTAPEVIAAGNIGCMMQIGSGTTVPIVHTVELVDWATGGPEPRALAKKVIDEFAGMWIALLAVQVSLVLVLAVRVVLAVCSVMLLQLQRKKHLRTDNQKSYWQYYPPASPLLHLE